MLSDKANNHHLHVCHTVYGLHAEVEEVGGADSP